MDLIPDFATLPKKKLAHLVLRGAAKIHAVVDAAASSIERDGIGCTSRLEQTLFDDMTLHKSLVAPQG